MNKKKLPPPVIEKDKTRYKSKNKPWRFGSAWLSTKVFYSQVRENGEWVKKETPIDKIPEKDVLHWWVAQGPMTPYSRYRTSASAMQAWGKLKLESRRDFEHSKIWIENTETGEVVGLA